MPEKRKKFDQEFRAGAVRIVAETGKPIAAVARIWGLTRALTSRGINVAPIRRTVNGLSDVPEG